MQLVEPLQASWKAHLALGFRREADRTVLAKRAFDGPLVVQKPLYPEGPAPCHAIVVHPPGGIAGGDQLSLNVKVEDGCSVLLTAPGAGKWYRTAGPWAQQHLELEVDGALEWLPRETIVFDGASADLQSLVRLGSEARYIGWEIVCLGRTGAGERFTRGTVRLDNRIVKDGKLLWVERGEIEGGGRLMGSPVGLGGRSVFGTFIATVMDKAVMGECRAIAPATQLPGLLIARYLGDSTEEAFAQFTALWKVIRPALLGRAAKEPRIWRT